jgi:SAM-dependent methyltransferase
MQRVSGKLLANSDIEWDSYAKLNYGASDDLETGRTLWVVLQKQLHQYCLAASCRAVEIGCGNGRLTNALAYDFEAVDAIDISEARLRLARQNCRAKNIAWHLVREPLIPTESDVANLIISTHVMQHIQDRDVVESYFRESYRVLRRGGVMLMHIPVIGAHGTTGRLSEVARRRLKEAVKAAALPATRVCMRMGFINLPWKVDYYRWYEFPWLSAKLEAIGFLDIQLRLLPYAGGHSFLFGRR